jgi:hypothetical protein
MRGFGGIMFTVVVALSVFCIHPAVLAGDMEPGTVITIDCPDAMATAVREINARGDIVGRYTDLDGINHAFLREKADDECRCLSLDILGAVASAANGSNAAGDIVGWAWGPEIGYQTFLMKGNGDLMFFNDAPFGFHIPGDINAAGDVVGFYREVGDHLPEGWTEHGYLRSQDGEYFTVDFPESALTNVRGINESGDMVGLYAPDSVLGPYLPFLYSDGEFLSLDDFLGNANGINPQGQVVGNFMDEDGRHVGILDLKRDTFTSFDVPGHLIEAWAINPSGYVSGFYRDEDGIVHGFIRTPEH